MPIDKSELRRVIGHFATGVTIITTRDPDGKHFGMTANAVTSVSLVPPLLLVCVDAKADCFPCFESTKAFTVNILAGDQENLSRRFSTKGIEKFEGVGFQVGQNGCALLDGTLAHLECSVTESFVGGDHTIYLGQVDAADAQEKAPLLFFRGGYRQIST